jgi:hypothetical protein
MKGKKRQKGNNKSGSLMFREILTCVLMTYVNDSKDEIFYYNSYI